VRLVIWVGIGLAIFLAYSRPRVRDPRQTLVEDLT
jgi:hypothetical protein